MNMRRERSAGWSFMGLMATFVFPALMSALLDIRKRYGPALTLPSLAFFGGLWLWQRRKENRRPDAIPQSSSDSLPR